MGAPVSFRIGGNFTFPPLSMGREEFQSIDNVVLLAGGVGINPIMSIISAMDLSGAKSLGGLPPRLRLLYSSKRENGKAILFEERLAQIARKWARRAREDNVDFQYTLFETTAGTKPNTEQTEDIATMSKQSRRMTLDDLEEALGPEEKRSNTLVYVCGLPSMTDAFVDALKKMPGLDDSRIMFEKWW